MHRVRALYHRRGGPRPKSAMSSLALDRLARALGVHAAVLIDQKEGQR